MTTAPQLAKSKPYKRFDNRKAVFQLPPNAFKLWMYHYSRENADNESWPSIPTICRETGMSKDTVNNMRRYLTQNGWLRKVGERRTENGQFSVPVFSVDEGTIPSMDLPDTVNTVTEESVCDRVVKNTTPSGTEIPYTDRYGKTVQEEGPLKKERVLSDALQDFKNFSQSGNVPEGVGFEVEEEENMVKEKSNAERAANYLWTLLGTPTEFSTTEALTDWMKHMRDCMGEAELQDDLPAFKKFLHWVVKEHSYSAEWMTNAKNPAASLSKNLSGLLRRYRGEQNAKAAIEKKKKEREAITLQPKGDNLPQYRKDSGKRVVLKSDI